MEEDLVECPLCGGDGKETCDNPDHGFISAFMASRCPCCGYDEDHKVPGGGDCEVCEGKGQVTEQVCDDWCEEKGL